MTLSAAEQALIEEEETILQLVSTSLQARSSQQRPSAGGRTKDFEALREEAASAHAEDLPALFDQMNTQRALFERRADEALPDLRSPYFAHMKLEENGRVRDILLGHKTFLDVTKWPVIDWRHAPISRIFFNYREGEDYEEELPGRIAEGVVRARRIVTIHEGELKHIITPEASFRKSTDGEWRKENRHFIPHLHGGAGSASRAQHLGTGQAQMSGPEVSALLDPTQFELLNADSHEPLLILGGAGCGKTTVALHRMAVLLYREPKRFSQNQMLVVVPEQGLVRLSRRLLGSLNLGEVEVTTFDSWMERQARLLIRGLPKRVCDITPGDVSRFKRHPAIREAFPILVAQQAERLKQQLLKKVPDIGPWLAETWQDPKVALLPKLERLEHRFCKHLTEQAKPTTQQRLKVVREAFRKLKKEALNLNQDRNELFTSEPVLQAIVAASAGDLKPGIVKTVLSHSLDQFAQNERHDYRSMDKSKLEMVDGRSLIDDEDDDKYNTIDVEDFALLLELLHYKTGQMHSRHGKFRTYQHIVIDEAQDLAPIERNVLSRTMHEDTAVTIAGDAAQQIDPSTSFASWEQVLDELGVKRVRANHLTTQYRSTKQIAHFAHQILGPLAPEHEPQALREGVPVTVTPMPNDGQVSLFLNEALTNLMMEEPHACVAIISKTPEFAQKLYDVLQDIPKLRLVENGAFDFRPGIELTTADQVKGLEFDYVIIPDAGALFYRDRPEDRRLLHVAATRAIHQLWVMTVGKPSPLLPAQEENI
jgi:DNA helicase-2/ATP-dependent DNA helicase PcrA